MPPVGAAANAAPDVPEALRSDSNSRPPIAHHAPVALSPSALKLPGQLLALLKQRGTTLEDMMRDFPECIYMGEFDMMLRDLMFMEPPVNAHEIVKVKDPSAFTSFFTGPAKDTFSKWLVLFDLNEKILNMTETGDRFPAEHYVPTLVTLMMQRDSPFFIITKCLDIVTGLHNAGESALRHMCKIESLPTFLAELVDQLCDSEEARDAVGAYAMLADSCIELLCNIVIKSCADRLLQPTGLADPEFQHAQSLRSICIRLLKRFKHLPSVSHGSDHEPSEQQPQLAFRIKSPANILNIIWSLASLCSVADIPFPEAQARHLFHDLLCYVANESEDSIMHAFICILQILLKRLHSPSAAACIPGAVPEVSSCVQDKCVTANALLNLLSQPPCDMGSKGKAQPQDYSVGDGRSQGRGAPRHLVGPLAVLQEERLSDLVFSTLCACASEMKVAADCITFGSGKLLSIISEKIESATSLKQARPVIVFCERLMDTLCNSNLRNAVFTDAPFPPELIEHAHVHASSSSLRHFFDTLANSPHASRLHGDMLIPALGSAAAVTLRDLSNKTDGGDIAVLAHAAASGMHQAVKMLLQLGADPLIKSSSGKNAIEFCNQHNSGDSYMIQLLQSAEQLRVVPLKEPSKGNPNACMLLLGKDAAELLAPLWDALLGSAANSHEPNVCFAVLESMCRTISIVDLQILQNLFVVEIAEMAAGDGTPSAGERTPNAGEAPILSSFDRATSSSGIKCQAAPCAERFFKLLGHSAKKFSRSSSLLSHAISSLKALKVLFQIPQSRSLLRLCHKMKLVDPILSAVVEKSAGDRQRDPQPLECDALSRFDSLRLFEGHDSNDDDDEESLLAAFGAPSSRGGHAFMRPRVSPSRPFNPSVVQLQVDPAPLLCDLRELLLPFATSAVDLEGSEEFDGITQALTAAVTCQHSPRDFSRSFVDAATATAAAALSSLKSMALRGALSERLDSPSGFRLIKALRAFMHDVQGVVSPVHVVIRREMFRLQFCPPQFDEMVGKQAGLKALLVHALSLFEDNHSEVLALCDQQSRIPASIQGQHSQSSGAFEIQLRPMPNDDGCRKHFGSASRSFLHNASSDFRSVAAALNFKEVISQEQSGGAALAPPSSARRPPGQESSFESRAKELTVAFPPPAFCMRSGLDSQGLTLRFRSAVPLHSAIKHAEAGSQSSVTGKKSKKKGKSKASNASAVVDLSSDHRLQPSDIPRARLFLCHESDVKDGQLPQLHVEVDPCAGLSNAVSELQKISRSSKLAPARPHSGHQCIFPNGCGASGPHRTARDSFGPHWSCCDQLVSLGTALRHNYSENTSIHTLFFCLAHCEKTQPLALFFGSGQQPPELEPRVPFELQWSISSLTQKIDSGVVTPLSVVEAIKTAMPADWLAAHRMSTDSVSVAFSSSDQDILDLYKAALNAWGAADVIESCDQPCLVNKIPEAAAFSAGADGAAAAVSSPATSVINEAANQGEALLQLMQMLTGEFERCSSTLVQTDDLFQSAQTSLSIKDLAPLQSNLVSAMFKAASGRNSDFHSWTCFARKLPLILDHSCRLRLFRQFTQTSPENLLALRQDRVNSIDRSHLLEWAAAIVVATRDRRNPLCVQYAHEAGFGEAVTSSFFSEVADAFAFADLGMWYIHGDDTPEEFQSDEAHRTLLASNGLFPQPYCASHPMPSNVLHNFKLLGCMMGKALHDGRAFPLRISYSLARCICGEDLGFEDLGAILSPQQFDCLSRLRSFVVGGATFPSDAIDFFGNFQLYCHIPDASSGRLVVRSLELVPGGSDVDLCEANAHLFLKGFERIFLRDGVALQIQALRDGFYSVVPFDSVTILGASGLLRELCCLEVAPFDEEDVKFGLLPVNGYDINSPQFQWLINSMLEFSEQERAAFLRWVRGAPSLPSGFKGLHKRITVQVLTTDSGAKADGSYLPKVQTCQGMIKLPLYDNPQQLHEKLLRAMFDA